MVDSTWLIADDEWTRRKGVGLDELEEWEEEGEGGGDGSGRGVHG